MHAPLLLLALAAPAAAERWCFAHVPKQNEVAVVVGMRVGPPSYVRLPRFAGELDYDPAAPESARVKVSMDADEAQFDRTLALLMGKERPLKGAIRYASRSAAPKGSRVLVSGELTMNGVSKPVGLDVERLPAEDGAGPAFRAMARVNRFDFKLELDGAMFAVHDDVDVLITLRRLRKAGRGGDPCGAGF